MTTPENSYEQRIQQLEHDLDEMTAALARAWDQLAPLLQQTPHFLHLSGDDVTPMLQSLITALDAAAVSVFFVNPREYVSLPAGILPPSQLEAYLRHSTPASGSFELTDADDEQALQWLFIPIVTEEQVHGAFGVALNKGQRPFTSLDVRVLERMAQSVESQIVTARLVRVREGEAHLKRDLEIANQIQRSIQPPNPPIFGGMRVFSDWQPALGVGGDAWGWVKRPKGEISFFILDVAGKGLPAALAAVSLHTAVKMALRLNIPLVEVMRTVNEEFYDTFDRSELMATLCIFSIQPYTRSLEQVNAGHLPTLIRRGDTWIHVPATMPPIGTFLTTRSQMQMVRLEPQDVIMVYSDGFTEIETADGFWGEEGLIGAVPADTSDPDVIGAQILATAKHVSGDVPRHDDQTLLVIGCKNDTTSG